ncbi:MAG: glycosyltransferase [Patescibacteria group bacterium]|nr:glycosyltransferase [Patescibacteria group bacterium]
MMIHYLSYSRPSTGGDFVNLQHVSLLQQQGLPARLVYVGENPVPELPPHSQPLHAARFEPGDDLVIPENNPDFYRIALQTPCRPVIHNQNSYLFFAALARLQGFTSALFPDMLCPSHSNAGLVRAGGYDGRIGVVYPGLPDYFSAAPKQLQIAYAPRKLPLEAAALRGFFSRRHMQLSHVPWVEISGMPRPQLAQVLSESAIYAALSDKEAISLSVLEAMQSGCIVVGDHGGSTDYATQENGIWCQADDLIAFADALAMAIGCFNANGSDNRYANAARSDAARFHLEATRDALFAYWAKRLK